MRFVAHILAALILFLSVEPGIAAILSTQQAECHCGDHCIPISEYPEKKDNPKKSPDQGQNNCNPFQVCSSCISYALPTPFVYTIAITYTLKKQYPSDVRMHSQFTPDFWQPPKIG